MPKRNTPNHSPDGAPRFRDTTDNWEFGHRPPPAPVRRRRPRSLAVSLVFVTLFCAGGAFTAFAGDSVSRLDLQNDANAPADASASADVTTDHAAPAAEPAPAADPAPVAAPEAAPAAPEPAPAADAAPEAEPTVSHAASAPADAAVPAATDASPAPAPADASAAPAADAAATPEADPVAKRSSSATAAPAPVTRKPAAKPVVRPAPAAAPPPEVEGPRSGATVWLNVALPDPTPPSARLDRAFALNLRSVAASRGVDWALLLGVLRADGANGASPAGRASLVKLAGRLSGSHGSSGDWSAALAYARSTGFADRATALARYDRAVGLAALVSGLEAAKSDLANRVLSNPQISMYAGGREDIAAGKVDVRVLALVAYLSQCYGGVTVSSLVSGHRLYARPGVVSAHVYGHAVDIAALGGVPIQGHQEPGGLTEHAVRDILLLPSEVMPRQVISLIGLGGPSFPLADHYNHIHIGY